MRRAASCLMGHGNGTLYAQWLPFALVPGGTFQRDDDPANTTTASAFSMSTFPITQVQHVAVTGMATPS